MTMDIIPTDGPRPFAPRVSDFTQRFWQSLADGRFETTVCSDCGKAGFPPRPICRHCWSRAMEWKSMATTGQLYTHTSVHVAPRAFATLAPYTIGLVDLEDGLRLMCRVITDGKVPEIGTPVDMVVLAHEDGPLFAARLVGDPVRKDIS